MIMRTRQVCSLYGAKTSSSVVPNLLCFVCCGKLGGEIMLLALVLVALAREGSSLWESWLSRTSSFGERVVVFCAEPKLFSGVPYPEPSTG